MVISDGEAANAEEEASRVLLMESHSKKTKTKGDCHQRIKNISKKEQKAPGGTVKLLRQVVSCF